MIILDIGKNAVDTEDCAVLRVSVVGSGPETNGENYLHACQKVCSFHCQGHAGKAGPQRDIFLRTALGS